MKDRVQYVSRNLCLEIPPKHRVSEIIGKLKGKTTILGTNGMEEEEF